MRDESFDYEEGFMGVCEKKPKSYLRTFSQDYRLRSLTRVLRLKKGKILDIGCGGGILTESLSHYFPKVEIYGCDVSVTAISYAKKLGSGKVKYSVIKNKKLAYSDIFFDACICLDVLEHVPDVNFLLREVKRVLKQDGKVFFIVPCEGQIFTFTWLFQKLKLGDHLTFRYFGHIHPEFTYVSVIKLLKKNGFSEVDRAYSEHVFYQFLQYCLYFLPKIFLEFVLGGKRANQYTNSSFVKSPKRKNDPLVTVRNIWYSIWDFMMFYPMNWETVLLRKFPIGAWKLHILVTKKE